MQTTETRKKDIVGFFLKKGLLVNNELLEYLRDEQKFSEFAGLVGKTLPENITVLNNKIEYFISQHRDLNWEEFEKLEVASERSGIDGQNLVNSLLAGKNTESKTEEKSESRVKVVSSYEAPPKKREANDFIEYFNIRYLMLEKLLKHRPGMQNIVSINRISNKKNREEVSVVGMVMDKQDTKNGNCIITIEDRTGSIKTLINKNRQDLHKTAKDVVLDEVIGVTGVNGNNIIFANSIMFPGVPSTKEIKKCEDEAYALFLSDVHVGSKDFLKQDFNRFLKWINQETGTEAQKHIASTIKYIFIIGDLVDGCGVYPGQEKELEIKDIKDQYMACAELLKNIPSHIEIIICPGNHDAMRLAEPQLPIYRDFAEPLYQLPNATLTSNPAVVNIHSSGNFPGFDVLLYHGCSFDFYVTEVESIRNNGGYDRADLLMKFLLQKRHLAPSYTSTLYVPDIKSDFLVIDKVPDFFVSGHIHKASATNYKGITLISSSCWQGKTAYQEKVGHNPEPSRVPIVNLQTRQMKILKFGKS
ncbi:MAG: DNA-directed DNA polymerase II small subunit [Nanoarchaeota archaeon]